MILCCGEALIDMIPTPTTTGTEGFVPLPGGAVFNTAIALGRLGTNVAFLSGLSQDRFGQQLSDALKESAVNTDLLIRSDRPTTLAFVHLANGQASYSFFDENSAGRMITIDDLPALPPDIPALYFGGISLACEPAADTYATLLAREGDARLVMLDPNIRPGFIRDEPRFRTRLSEMIARSDILKLSDEDLHWLIPGDAPLAAKARKLLSQGPALLILTKGADGAEALLADGSAITVPAQTATVVDTVGAGDTFNAGVLAGLAQQGLLSKQAIRVAKPEDLQKPLALGAKVAAITVSRAGANPPWSHEV